ncbi:MAG: ornithine carbamoyltransferase [Variovorax paradoxus]|uniref:Ornithine carbamoyltransferase n=1 Tax=Variovorax paradoxus TaxID=34073 RepID=A0A2W5QJ72_VARPD|nr:MAG: ornithine carbamoyltransferase [Variovorax paradoxus]
MSLPPTPGRVFDDPLAVEDATGDIVGRARQLWTARQEGRPPQPLRGRHLGLVYAVACSRSQALFCDAAHALGAQVAVMPLQLRVDDPPHEVSSTARMLGRLYEAIECQGVEPIVVGRIAEHAGIPVLDDAAVRLASLDLLAQRVQPGLPARQGRTLVLQALILHALA